MSLLAPQAGDANNGRPVMRRGGKRLSAPAVSDHLDPFGWIAVVLREKVSHPISNCNDAIEPPAVIAIGDHPHTSSFGYVMVSMVMCEDHFAGKLLAQSPAYHQGVK
jgi:hypothetical protein